MTPERHPLALGTGRMMNTRDRAAPAVRTRRAAIGAAALIAVAFATGCDTTVTNPGRFEDRYLDDPAAHVAVVNGGARSVADALNNVAYTTAAITRELFPAGSTSSFGITPRQQQGILAFDDEHINSVWTAAQRARFITEVGIQRFQAAREAAGQSISDYEPAARAALWAGYANRILAANFCEVTIEGGPAISSDSVYRRSEAWFTRALEIGQKVNKADIINAAYAGRASVRVGLGNWEGAVADAQKVPTSFKFVADYNESETSQYNRIFWAGASTPYRAHTVWRTVNEKYFEETKDPRVPWGLHATQKEGDAAVLDLGKVPFYQQRKYPERGSDINLSTGREMRLIEAEAKLRQDDWQAALAMINELRTATGVAPVTASNIEEAWTRLKRERGIELWLEGRRLSDLRRWQEATNTPGQLDPLEVPGEASRLVAERSLCYQIPKSERETNPNLPLTP
jgi:hypothetical protein